MTYKVCNPPVDLDHDVWKCFMMFANTDQPRRLSSLALEDELQNDPDLKFKRQELLELLLVGGYFRARISALSSWDRIVGGLVWCITLSNVHLDVDVIFQENSSIGERIKICESIVKALITMKCPYPIQSHQIQGLDYDHLFPVIQWSVRKVMETRQITGDLIRKFTVSQFFKHYDMSEPKPSIKKRKPIVRKFRKVPGDTFQEPERHVEGTLLEYGTKIYTSVVTEPSDKTLPKSSVAGVSGQDVTAKELEIKKAALEHEKMSFDELESNLAAVERSNISGSNIGMLVSLRSDEIKSANQEYSDEMAKLQADAASGLGTRAVAAAHQRQVQSLQKQIAVTERTLSEKLQTKANQQAVLDEKQASLHTQAAYIQKIQTETEKLDNIELTSVQKTLLSQLKGLVLKNEHLKKQESSFRTSCTNEVTKLRKLITELQSHDHSQEDEDKFAYVERMFLADSQKLDKIKTTLMEKNQAISRIIRKIDDVPTRAELLQYERRFVELYELVAEKLVETRRYFELYNILDSTNGFLAKQVSLLESIQEGFPKSIKTQLGKDNFLEGIKKAIDGVASSYDKIRADLDSEQATLETLNKKYARLVAEQRKYYKTVKEFQLECCKNEKFSSAVSALQ